MGYELSVTPVQLAAAYATIANGGMLLEPALVREIRDAEGEVVWKHRARAVRRVMTTRTAATMRAMLRSVVDSGTATDADLASFTLGGKSGTVRRIERGKGYTAGHYNAVFAGMFPVEDPQYVIVVKIDNPAGVYYGGKVAAPITKVVLQAALAARDAALDRTALAERVLPKARDAYTPKLVAGDTLPPPAAPVAPIELRRERLETDTLSRGVVRYVVDLPAPRVAVRGADAPSAAARESGTFTDCDRE
jgi:membrane peptidoglycan carboxypeptidase